jgi:hypothetical protein
MTPPNQPTYDLSLIQKKILRRFEHTISHTAASDARALGFGEDQIRQCVCGLDPSMFYKTMPATEEAGLSQDVYRAHYQEYDLYVKVQIDQHDRARVVSFKERKAPWTR